MAPEHACCPTAVRRSLSPCIHAANAAANLRAQRAKIGPCCPLEELRHDWFPRVDAGESARLKAAGRLPDGFATVVASATPMQSPKRVIDADASTKTATVVMIGEPR